MKKSLFSKLLRTYVYITFICIIIISSLFYIFFSQYYFKVKEHQLLFQGREMSEVLSPYFKNNELSQINLTVNHFNKVNISHMWVVDKNGVIINDSEDLATAHDLCPRSDQLARALKGETVAGKGVIKYTNDPVLSVALPIVVDGKVAGAIFVCNPLSDIINSIFQTFKIVIFAGIMAIFIASCISYFISKSIVKPIKEITDISLELSKGNFSQRAKVHSPDEIGKLAETFNDMTIKLDKSLRDLENEKNKMAKIEKMQREFVANTSHELRTPLTSLRGYLEAILDGVVSGKEQERKYLRIILKETLRLHRLVNSLLDLSRIESGQIKANKKEINISEIADRTAAKLEPLAEEKELQLHVNVPADLPTAFGDEDLVEQVLINYITNAIRFTPSGGTITVTAESDATEVAVHVADTGIGIPPEELPEVWKRFYKINDARPLSKEGAGLGLALVKEIMELLGGKAWATSIPDKGSTFSFSLAVFVKK